MMKLAAATTLIRLLYAVNLRPHGPRSDVVEREIPIAGDDQVASLFEPLRQPRRTLVLVHGVTGRANADPLLTHLGRSLAALGYRCVAPALGHLSRFRHDPRDIETLVAAIETARHLDSDPVGILAFSYGASYALVAASDPRVSHGCAALVGFGAYYQLAEALEHQRQLLIRHPDLEQDDTDLAYLRYTLLACHRDSLDLSADAWCAIDEVLVSFTSSRPVQAVRAPLLRYAKHFDYVALMQRYQQRELSSRLSPAGSLSGIRCPVGLLHDPNDRFVPPTHVDRIAEVLDARPEVPATEILTTPMLSHVQVNPMRRIFDLPKLVRLLEPLLGYR